jgi:diguanylate cyclase (GGDEF)-like protein
MAVIGAYTAVGLFGLHPAAWKLVAPAPPGRDRLSVGRLVFLGVAVAAVPIDIGLKLLGQGSRDGVVLVVSSATITTLVMVRIGQLSAQRDLAEAALRHEASHDSLTGLANRKEFTAQVSNELATHNHSAIVFCDLNRFKAINDQYGHAQGDRVLIEVAQRIRGCIRVDDLACRLGGDEFVVLLRNTSAQQARLISDRIMESVARPVLIADQAATVGITVGTAFSIPDEFDPEQLIKRADQAMYLTKETGR